MSAMDILEGFNRIYGLKGQRYIFSRGILLASLETLFKKKTLNQYDIILISF